MDLNIPARKKETIVRESVRLLYQHSLQIIPINVIISTLVLFWMIMDNVPLLLGFFWWLGLLLLSLVRFLYSLQVIKKQAWQSHLHRIKHFFIWGALLTGSIWGAAYVLFSPYLSLMHRIYLILVLGGIAAGGCAPLSSLKSSYLLFVVPTLLPTIVMHLWDWNVNGVVVAIMFIFYLLSLVVMGLNTNRVIQENVILRLHITRLLRIKDRSNKKLKRLYKKIESLSLTDELTGLANRRFLNITLNKTWEMASRSKAKIGVMLIDVDYFKEYNDHYGHIAGDICLQRVAAAINRLVKRQGDLCARYGGDEYIVVLLGIEQSKLMDIAVQIKQAIQNLQMPHAQSKASAYVSVSIGVTLGLPGATTKSNWLIGVADQALYSAKKQGRNQIKMLVTKEHDPSKVPV